MLKNLSLKTKLIIFIIFSLIGIILMVRTATENRRNETGLISKIEHQYLVFKSVNYYNDKDILLIAASRKSVYMILEETHPYVLRVS